MTIQTAAKELVNNPEKKIKVIAKKEKLRENLIPLYKRFRETQKEYQSAKNEYLKVKRIYEQIDRILAETLFIQDRSEAKTKCQINSIENAKKALMKLPAAIRDEIIRKLENNEKQK